MPDLAASVYGKQAQESLMKTMQSLQRNRLLAAVLAAFLATFAGASYAAGTEAGTPGMKADTPASKADTPATKADTPAMPSPKMGATTMAPSKTDTADAAFRKLDATGKGYVSRDDVKTLPGFEQVFEKFNTKHDGKLTRDEFAKAWDAYKAT
jgi:hypothetical protein